LVDGSNTSCATTHEYHGGMNIHGLGASHLNDRIGGLNGGPLGDLL